VGFVADGQEPSVLIVLTSLLLLLLLLLRSFIYFKNLSFAL